MMVIKVSGTTNRLNGDWTVHSTDVEGAKKEALGWADRIVGEVDLSLHWNPYIELSKNSKEVLTIDLKKHANSVTSK